MNRLLLRYAMVNSPNLHSNMHLCKVMFGVMMHKLRKKIFRISLILFTAALFAFNANAQESASESSTSEKLENANSIESDFAKNPLEPPDTSSPRATLQGFIDNMNRAYRILMAAHRENIKTPGLFPSDSVQQLAQQAETLFQRGVYSLNLSEVPDRLKQDAGYEGAIMLKEILDRIALPPAEKIPGSADPKAGIDQTIETDLNLWRIPRTEIVIERVEEGPQEGEYLFSPETVLRLREFYAKVKDRPYKLDSFISHDFYDFYTTTPGRLLPPKWSQWLPSWAGSTYFDQTLWQWFVLIVLPVVALLAIRVLVRWWYKKTDALSSGKRTAGWFLIILATVAMVSLVKYVLDEQVNITGPVLILVDSALGKVFILLLAAIIFWEFMKARIQRNLKDDEQAEDTEGEEMGPGGSRSETLLLLLNKSLMAVMIAVVGLLILSSMGVNIGPLLAGAGVIGLAIGFGAQTLVRDIFSGIFFLIDDAFRVGDYIETGSMKGRVQHISVRSLTLRHPRGMLITIPFGDIKSVKNFSRDYVIMKLDFRVRYDTDVDKVRKIVKKINKAIQKDEELSAGLLGKIKSQGVREMHDSAMIMRVKFKCIPGKQFAIRREVYRRMQEAFRKNGIEFAHRNVTVYFPPENGNAEPENEDKDKPAATKAAEQKTKEAAAAAALRTIEEEQTPEKKSGDL